jgi:hypothetical protein
MLVLVSDRLISEAAGIELPIGMAKAPARRLFAGDGAGKEGAVSHDQKSANRLNKKKINSSAKLSKPN